MKKIKSFYKEVLARVAGDTAAVISEKNYRRATAAIKQQLSSLVSQGGDQEDAVETAKEELDNVLFPASLIQDKKEYVRNIDVAQEVVNKAEEALADTIYSIEYFEGILVRFDEEVPVLSSEDAKGVKD